MCVCIYAFGSRERCFKRDVTSHPAATGGTSDVMEFATGRSDDVTVAAATGGPAQYCCLQEGQN